MEIEFNFDIWVDDQYNFNVRMIISYYSNYYRLFINIVQCIYNIYNILD